MRDALLRDQHDWIAVIATELRNAVAAGEIEKLDVDLVAFQIDAILFATNTALRLGEAGAVDRARRIVEGFLRPPR